MRHKISKFPYKGIRHAIATPFILGMAIPLVPFDMCLEIYHHVTFPLYNIPLNIRHNYIRIDHHKLSYLSPKDKVWCMYCSYANGLMAYGTKIAGDTEAYWCGVKHKEDDGFIPQPHQEGFLPFDDEKAYKEYLDQE